MTSHARRIVLPRYTVTETAAEHASGISAFNLPDGGTYYVRHKFIEGEDKRIDGLPRWVEATFNRYPIVLRGNGEPWDEANVWILSTIEGKPEPSMDTYLSIAEDMAAYCRFLEEHNLDWTDFPAFKLRRPTYRYNAHIKTKINIGEIKASTGRRRMSRVISFYRWLRQEALFVPEHPAWVEGEAFIPVVNDARGERMTLRVKTTDVGINVPKELDPLDETIQDGGKLRPLPANEQEWLADALSSLNHTEVSLAHIFALATGARIQTVLTMKARHFQKPLNNDEPVRLAVGPGTGIDTKGSKRLILIIPSWLYRVMQSYTFSDRARKRRTKAVGGDHLDQYLFLTATGAPYYANRKYDDYKTRRHAKRGQAMRQYIKKFIIPFIQKKYKPTFAYQFHDLRATFGMNLVDACRVDMDAGTMTYTDVLRTVADRMGHNSVLTTESYLKYRERLRHAKRVQKNWEAALQALTEQAMRSAARAQPDPA